MKRPALIAVGLAAAALATTQGWADNTDTSSVPVGGVIVASLELTTSTNLVMPHVTRPVTGDAPSTTARVTLICGPTDGANTVSYVPNSNPFAAGTPHQVNPSSASANAGVAGAGATGTCAVLSVAGQPNYNFVFTISGVTSPTIPTGVTFDNVTCIDSGNQLTLSGNTVTLDGAGAQSLRCGGRITVATDTAAGNYLGGSYTATVTYD